MSCEKIRAKVTECPFTPLKILRVFQWVFPVGKKRSTSLNCPSGKIKKEQPFSATHSITYFFIPTCQYAVTSKIPLATSSDSET